MMFESFSRIKVVYAFDQMWNQACKSGFVACSMNLHFLGTWRWTWNIFFFMILISSSEYQNCWLVNHALLWQSRPMIPKIMFYIVSEYSIFRSLFSESKKWKLEPLCTSGYFLWSTINEFWENVFSWDGMAWLTKGIWSLPYNGVVTVPSVFGGFDDYDQFYENMFFKSVCHKYKQTSLFRTTFDKITSNQPTDVS